MISGAQGMMSSVLRILTSGILAGAMIHSGATVIDSLPHGSFFHATGGSVNMAIKDRMKLIPYEALVGLTSTVVSILNLHFIVVISTTLWASVQAPA